MFFYVAKIVGTVIYPMGIAIILLMISALSRLVGRKRLAFICNSLALLELAIIFITPLIPYGVAILENRFPIPQFPACLTGIVVLGGGEQPEQSAVHQTPLISGAPMRYIVLSDLMARYPNAKVVFSGGSGRLGGSSMQEADVSRGIMEKLHLDVTRAAFESRSRDTWENAVYSKELAQPKQEETWILLASASHMPRSVGVFRKIGWHIIPWPTDFDIGAVSWKDLDFSAHNIHLADTMEHEWLGLAAYWLTGRTAELFPASSTLVSGNASCSDSVTN